MKTNLAIYRNDHDNVLIAIFTLIIVQQTQQNKYSWVSLKMWLAYFEIILCANEQR